MTTPVQAPPWWQPENYLCAREIGGGMWICLGRMIYTTRLMLCDPLCVYEFYCYPDEEVARAAYEAWSGIGDPLDGWIKHHPSERRRSA